MKRVVLYGLALAVFTGLLKWLEYRFLITHYAFEIYALFIGAFFLALGIWAGRKLTTPKVQIEKEIVVVEKQVPVNLEFSLNRNELGKRGISDRELEVLRLVSAGLSNQEIADKLFVSLSTVKTHISNLFLKLEVTRRTQAVQKAKEISLLP